MKKYLFIDRDGTLVCEPDDFQVDSVEKIRLKENVIPALLSLKEFGYSFVMVSNQDGLGTESFPLESYTKSAEFILDLFLSQGIDFEQVLICPHKPSENCQCRKPKLGLVMEYLKDTSWDREKSYVIGDRATDVELAKNMGIGSFLINDKCSWSQIASSIIHNTRTSYVHRKTNETDIEIYVNLDKFEKSKISTGIGFFDHMLDQIATHAKITLEIKVKGDLHIDNHHTIEDTAIVLGQALKQALGEKRGIARFGFVLPMDEVYAQVFANNMDDCMNTVALDISSRPYANLHLEANLSDSSVGQFPSQMLGHFFQSLAFNLGISLYMKVSDGNCHHQIEALFKAFGRALGQAIRTQGSSLPSSKGVL